MQSLQGPWDQLLILIQHDTTTSHCSHWHEATCNRSSSRLSLARAFCSASRTSKSCRSWLGAGFFDVWQDNVDNGDGKSLGEYQERRNDQRMPQGEIEFKLTQSLMHAWNWIRSWTKLINNNFCLFCQSCALGQRRVGGGKGKNKKSSHWLWTVFKDA
jgi:hypothetical protein